MIYPSEANPTMNLNGALAWAFLKHHRVNANKYPKGIRIELTAPRNITISKT